MRFGPANIIASARSPHYAFWERDGVIQGKSIRAAGWAVQAVLRGRRPGQVDRKNGGGGGGMARRAVIVGGGAIGLTAAWALRRRAFDVTVVEKGEPGMGCSVGNAGFICPSLSAPLPAPGLVGRSLRWMLHSGSPLYISRVRLFSSDVERQGEQVRLTKHSLGLCPHTYVETVTSRGSGKKWLSMRRGVAYRRSGVRRHWRKAGECWRRGKRSHFR